MVSYGDEVDVNDYGVCKLLEDEEDKAVVIYLVEEEDGSINWYLDYQRSDEVLLQRWALFQRER